MNVTPSAISSYSLLSFLGKNVFNLFKTLSTSAFHILLILYFSLGTALLPIAGCIRYYRYRDKQYERRIRAELKASISAPTPKATNSTPAPKSSVVTGLTTSTTRISSPPVGPMGHKIKIPSPNSKLPPESLQAAGPSTNGHLGAPQSNPNKYRPLPLVPQPGDENTIASSKTTKAQNAASAAAAPTPILKTEPALDSDSFRANFASTPEESVDQSPVGKVKDQVSSLDDLASRVDSRFGKADNLPSPKSNRRLNRNSQVFYSNAMEPGPKVTLQDIGEDPDADRVSSLHGANVTSENQRATRGLFSTVGNVPVRLF